MHKVIHEQISITSCRGLGMQWRRAASQEQGASSIWWQILRPDSETPQTCEREIFVWISYLFWNQKIQAWIFLWKLREL